MKKRIVKTLIASLFLIVGCSFPDQYYEPITVELNPRLEIDDNGFYHLPLDMGSWQTLHRFSGIVYESDRYMPRTYVEPKRAVPINIRTRGSPQDYQQMGILTNVSDSNDVRPLYGRQTYRGSNQWNYYSSLDSNLSTKIPIFKSTDKCTDERGCTEINDGDSVTIGNQDATTYNFTKYSNDSFRYIPDVF